MDTNERTGESDRPEKEVIAPCSEAVSRRCICLSAPVEKMNGRVDEAVTSLPSRQGLCQSSTEAASRFEDVGVVTIVGLDGAKLSSASIYTQTGGACS